LLRRIESISDGGIFEGFRWGAEVGDFQRINLILGTNGSGKTSLSRVLDSLATDPEAHVKVSLRLSEPDGSKARTSSAHPDDEFNRIVVFSDRYVTRSHRFDGAPEMDAVLTLGEKTLEAEARIAELKKLIDAQEGERVRFDGTVKKGERDLGNAHTRLRDAVVSDLSRAGGDYRSNGTYGMRVRSRFSGSHKDWALLPEAELASNKQIVASDARLEIPSRTYSVRIPAELRQDAQDLLAASPVSTVLDTLVAHPDASSWVDDGRHRHEGIDTCIYCGSPLTAARKSEIEAHFSDEVTTTQSGLDRLIRELRGVEQQVSRMLDEAPDPGLLFEDLRDDFQKARAAVAKEVEQLQKWMAPLLDALKAKRENVLLASKFAVSEPPTIEGGRLEASIELHNERVANHESLVQEAARKVERHHLKAAEEEVAEIEASIADAREGLKTCEGELRSCREEIASLESVEGDPLPSAQTLTREVARLLGRGELVFELAADGSKYLVMRHGEPARHLSTGERRAITLVHFLEGVRNATDGSPIVVIDDPVSSLDSNVATGISQYIWSETVVKGHMAQIFVLTHDFELFKQWDFQIEGLHRNSRLKANFPAQCYELVAPHQTVNGAPRRVAKLLKWPPSEDAKRKLRSTYHHAFIMVARAAIALRDDDSTERRLDALLLYPNVIRRMLESFLAFKRPALVGRFADVMRASATMLVEAGYDGDADLIRLRLSRFTNTHSHDESPETDITLNPDEIGPTISAAFTFMNALDQEHFEGLCKVVGVNATDLLLKIDVPAGDPPGDAVATPA